MAFTRNSILLTLFFLLFSFYLDAQKLYINEVMAKNDNVLLDEDGDSPDWIELYNAEDTSINLQDFSLSDDINNKGKWKLPLTHILPKSYLIVFASGKDRSGAELHANFKLKSEGEKLFLSAPSLTEVDACEYFNLLENESYGRKEDGSSTWVKFTISSPGKTNNTQTGKFQLQISHPSQAYSNSFTLSIASIPGIKICYTLNGNIPSAADPEFSGSLNLPVGLLQESKIELTPTTPLEGPNRLKELIWKHPKGNTSKANVVRFRAFKSAVPVSDVFTRVYLPVSPNQKAHFEYAFITTDSLNLFHRDSGIYLPGKHFDTLGYSGWMPEGNYNAKGKQYEKSAHFSFFSKKGNLKIDENVGIRMHGNSSTAKAQKGFKVFFRNEYGKDELDYNFFNLKTSYSHERIILRNGGSDLSYVLFRDAMLQSLMQDLGLETQNSKPVLLYLNGVYWGIYNIRDDLNHDFIHQKYGHDKDSINIAWNCGGHSYNDNIKYRNFQGWLASSNINDSNTYKRIDETIDVPQFINYYLSEIYFGNFDWPGNNFLLWYTNKKMKPLVFDLDYTFGNPIYNHDHAFDFNTLVHATSPVQQHWSNATCATSLLRNLLRNDSFKNLFIASFQHLMSNDFSFEHVNQRIDSFVVLYEPAMQQHLDRWGHPGSTIDEWKDQINKMRLYALHRPCALQGHFTDYFGEEIHIPFDKLPESESNWVAYPNPSCSGSVKLYRKGEKEVSGTYFLFDSKGRQKKTSPFNLSYQNKFHFTLPTNNLAPGIYIVHFLIEGNSEATRIVVRKH